MRLFALAISVWFVFVSVTLTSISAGAQDSNVEPSSKKAPGKKTPGKDAPKQEPSNSNASGDTPSWPTALVTGISTLLGVAVTGTVTWLVASSQRTLSSTLQAQQQTHTRELQDMQQVHTRELQELQQVHTQELQELQLRHARQLQQKEMAFENQNRYQEERQRVYAAFLHRMDLLVFSDELDVLKKGNKTEQDKDAARTFVNEALKLMAEVYILASPSIQEKAYELLKAAYNDTGEQWELRKEYISETQQQLGTKIEDSPLSVPSQETTSTSPEEQVLPDAPPHQEAETQAAHKSQTEAIELPIVGYDSLSRNQIFSKLRELSAEEIERLQDYEAKHKNRRTFLNRFEERIRMLR